MIDVTEHPQGAVLPVRAKPGARRNELLDEHAGALRVSVTAAPEQGKANDAIIAVLAENLNLRRSQISLLTGPTSKIKRFLIEGIRPDDLLARIDAALTPTLFEPPDPDV